MMNKLEVGDIAYASRGAGALYRVTFAGEESCNVSLFDMGDGEPVIGGEILYTNVPYDCLEKV